MCLGGRLDVNKGDGCTHAVAQHSATVEGDVWSGAITFDARFRVDAYVLYFAIPRNERNRNGLVFGEVLVCHNRMVDQDEHNCRHREIRFPLTEQGSVSLARARLSSLSEAVEDVCRGESDCILIEI